MAPLSWNNIYQIKKIEEEGILLLSEWDRTFLVGKTYRLLEPFLSEGAHSEDELVDHLASEVPAEMVYYALERLRSEHLISERCAHLPEELRSLCGLLSLSEIDAEKALRSTTISVSSLDGPVDLEFLFLLNSYQIELIDDPSAADIALLLVHDYLEPDIAAFATMRKDKPWMLLRATGAHAWIGPFFEPNQAGCYSCLAKRLEHNRREETLCFGEEAPLHSSPTKLTSARSIAYQLAATELLKRIFLGKSETLERNILLFNPLELKMESHYIQPFSSCEKCHAEKPIPSGLHLQSRDKRDPTGDGYRILSPEETVQKYAHLISPVTGIVKYLERITHPIGPNAHVYTSGTNWALPHSLKNKASTGFRNHCSGKGTTEAIAKAGALCEALERFSGIYRETDTQRSASFRELKEEAIHPHSILLISDSQYENRLSTNPTAHRFAKISEPFPEEKTLSWTPVYSLTEKKTKYLPTTICYFEMRDSEWKNTGDSNGCAAGNCLEEAILQGFFELVERDGIGIWWYNRLSMPGVDLESFSLPYIATLQKEYAQVNRELWALDLTTDLGIPTFAALSRVTTGEEERILLGFGTHFDAKRALLRAFTELNQMASNDSFWEKKPIDGPQEEIDKEIICDWLKNATLENQPYLKKKGPLKTLSDYPIWESIDLLEEIHQCQKSVEDLGMEFLVLDQTRPDVGLSVARVIVPGLRHFWTRFAPGRLYDVPVKMGWLAKPTPESELNPIPMFL